MVHEENHLILLSLTYPKTLGQSQDRMKYGIRVLVAGGIVTSRYHMYSLKRKIFPRLIHK